jgi:hypothetical protein
MGGIPKTLSEHSPADIAARVQSAIAEMGGRWLLLAPDCSIDIATPEELLMAARDAARPAA